MEYTINNADICELAHELTKQKCEAIRVKFEYISNNAEGDRFYSREAQKYFDFYYDLIFSKLIG